MFERLQGIIFSTRFLWTWSFCLIFLRTTEQGADTIVWLAITNNDEALKPEKSGDFFQDRVSVAKHLPLAWSRSSDAEENRLMSQLENFHDKFKENWDQLE